MVPAGNDEVLMDSGMKTLMVNGAVAVRPAVASVAVICTFDHDAALVGVPDSTPAVLSVRPGGRPVPLHVTEPEPPLEARVVVV